MKVSPSMRLSDDVIARSLVRFYQEQKLIPPGVSVEAMQPWAAKMSFAASKFVRRFRNCIVKALSRLSRRNYRHLRKNVWKKASHMIKSPQNLRMPAAPLVLLLETLKSWLLKSLTHSWLRK